VAIGTATARQRAGTTFDVGPLSQEEGHAMKQLKWVALASATGLMFLTALPAQAQTLGRPPGNPLGTPVLSPYLNLARGGNAAINYYGIVRPQQELRRDYQQLQQEILANQNALTTLDAGAVQLTTGHAARFFNYSHYYPVTYPLMEGGAAVAAPGIPLAPGLGAAGVRNRRLWDGRVRGNHLRHPNVWTGFGATRPIR